MKLFEKISIFFKGLNIIGYDSGENNTNNKIKLNGNTNVVFINTFYDDKEISDAVMDLISEGAPLKTKDNAAEIVLESIRSNSTSEKIEQRINNLEEISVSKSLKTSYKELIIEKLIKSIKDNDEWKEDLIHDLYKAFKQLTQTEENSLTFIEIINDIEFMSKKEYFIIKSLSKILKVMIVLLKPNIENIIQANRPLKKEDPSFAIVQNCLQDVDLNYNIATLDTIQKFSLINKSEIYVIIDDNFKELNSIFKKIHNKKMVLWTELEALINNHNIWELFNQLKIDGILGDRLS